MSTKFRIIEKEFKDGHKEYVAQESVKLFGVIIYWKDYVLSEDNYYGNTIRWICGGETYDGCLQQLKENLKEKEYAKLKNSIKRVNCYDLDL